MSRYSLSQKSDSLLLRDASALVARACDTTADLLAHLAEIDARKLYLPLAYPSMYHYCVGELRMSEDSVCRRIRAARAARQFPTIFPAVANGRLHLSAVVMLAPHLTEENAEELLEAAAGKSKSEIEQLLAARFPRPDVPTALERVGSTHSPAPLLQGPVGVADSSAPGRMETPIAPPKVAPLAPERFALQVTIGQSTFEKLQYAQALIGHQVREGQLATMIDRAFDALIERLEKRKFAATTRPRHRTRRSTAPRHIPAAVKRTVWERDGGRCTFVSEAGRRCPARSRLEFDHIDPVARGGQATVGGIRLRCRAHNQYAAECTFGVGFMSRKREEAQRRRAGARGEGPMAQLAPGRVPSPAPRRLDQSAPARIDAPAPQPNDQPEEQDVVPWLRKLGFRADEARQAAARCESIPDASLEQRLRLALSCLRPPHRVEYGAPRPA